MGSEERGFLLAMPTRLWKSGTESRWKMLSNTEQIEMFGGLKMDLRFGSEILSFHVRANDRSIIARRGTESWEK